MSIFWLIFGAVATVLLVVVGQALGVPHPVTAIMAVIVGAGLVCSMIAEIEEDRG